MAAKTKKSSNQPKRPALLKLDLEEKTEQTLRIWDKMLQAAEQTVDAVISGDKAVRASMVDSLNRCLTSSTKLIPQLKKAKEAAEAEYKEKAAQDKYLFVETTKLALMMIGDALDKQDRGIDISDDKAWFNDTFKFEDGTGLDFDTEARKVILKHENREGNNQKWQERNADNNLMGDPLILD